MQKCEGLETCTSRLLTLLRVNTNAVSHPQGSVALVQRRSGSVPEIPPRLLPHAGGQMWPASSCRDRHVSKQHEPGYGNQAPSYLPSDRPSAIKLT